MIARSRRLSAVLPVLAFLVGCGGGAREPETPAPSPARLADVARARAAATSADAKPDDATLQRAAFDAAAVLFATKGRYPESFEREAWPALHASVTRVLDAADDCPTLMRGAAIETGAGARETAVAIYTSAKGRVCITQDNLVEVTQMIREGSRPHCPEGIEMGPDLWQKAPRGAFVSGTPLSVEQINVLDMLLDCGATNAGSYVPAADLEVFRRYKAEGAAKQAGIARDSARQRAADTCADGCLAAYGEGDSTCMQDCHRRNAGSACVAQCRAALDVCNGRCGM